MLFKKENGARELRYYTSNYFANNDFSKVEGEIELATEELAQVVGWPVIELAERYAQELTAEDMRSFKERLVRAVKKPVAVMATLRMYRKNDLSHEDDGRKFKMATDGSERLPWEWQLQRDDEIHLEEYYRAVDSLIRLLNDELPEEWTASSMYREVAALCINSAREFEEFAPINGSDRLFMLIVPFIKEAQMFTVMPAYGEGFMGMVKGTDDGGYACRYAARKATALLAMAFAMRRMSLSLIPGGVIKQFMAKNGMRESKTVSLDDIQRFANWMQEDAAVYIQEMKKERDGRGEEYCMMPENNRKNKYCSL